MREYIKIKEKTFRLVESSLHCRIWKTKNDCSSKLAAFLLLVLAAAATTATLAGAYTRRKSDRQQQHFLAVCTTHAHNRISSTSHHCLLLFIVLLASTYDWLHSVQTAVLSTFDKFFRFFFFHFTFWQVELICRALVRTSWKNKKALETWVWLFKFRRKNVKSNLKNRLVFLNLKLFKFHQYRLTKLNPNFK